MTSNSFLIDTTAVDTQMLQRQQAKSLKRPHEPSEDEYDGTRKKRKVVYNKTELFNQS